MKISRLGNPLQIYWDFNLRKKGLVEDYPLEGKSLRLILISPRGKKEVDDFTVSGNVLSWVFTSDEQRSYGDHSLVLEVLSPDGDVLMSTKQCNFVRLVDSSCCVDDSENEVYKRVEEDSTIILSTELTVVRIEPVYPYIGENGNWWVDGKDTDMPARGEKGDVADAAYMEFEVEDDMNLYLSFLSTNDQLELEFNINEDGYLTVDK